MTAEKRDCVSILVGAGLSIAKACLFVGISRSTFYRPEQYWRKADAAVIDAINAELKKSPRAGFWMCFGRMRFKSFPFNHKRVYRVHCQMGLNLKRRTKRVLPKRIAQPLEVLEQANHQWALDFTHDTLYYGKRFIPQRVSDAYLFENLNQVIEMAWLWRLDYNDERIHESLGDLPPAAYLAKLENSNLELSH